MTKQTKITVEATVNAPVEKVWEVWNNPADIMQWNTADPSWHTPSSENDLRINGKFKNRMEAKDGSFGFDFEGTYNKVDLHKEIAYTMSDGRTASTVFEEKDGKTILTTTFDAETENDPEIQKQGWQAILNSFVKYVETRSIN
ncbi:MAG: SRPBCC family protein [Daejeonella sp.]|uniref:SRPBCC family protein n=1 Tax=Daejeonella sp. JGW-45 TaxID=3034148 RepID=UPI0023EE0F0A|nr:SRPBCC family protein [Daejeonella sp. JGW-45]